MSLSPCVYNGADDRNWMRLHPVAIGNVNSGHGRRMATESARSQPLTCQFCDLVRFRKRALGPRAAQRILAMRTREQIHLSRQRQVL